MKIKSFKNGNFNIKAEELNADLLHGLLNSHELDFQIAGEEGSTGNYDMSYHLYNSYTDMMYLVAGKDCTDYAQGKTVKLVGQELTEDERLEMEEETK